MFTKARLKLTTWYLLIIMAVSLSFSAFIYKSVTLEYQRRLAAIGRRLQLRQLGVEPPPGADIIFLQDWEEGRERLLHFLAYTNGVIFIISAAAGYFLAGRTLSPIERAMDEQKRFVADASHELKTPLTALQTSIEVALRDKKLNLKDAKNTLKESLKDIDDLKTLSNYLLNLARFQQDGSSFVKKKVNLKEIIDSASKKVSPLAKTKHIKLSVKNVNFDVKANKESLEKLFTILLDNAVKYTPKGGKVFLSAVKNNRNITVRVKDTGIGISKKDAPHIFERFYRADQSRSKLNVSGFGLGLSMTKQIVELHKGSVSVNSKLGKGTTFRVRLPIS